MPQRNTGRGDRQEAASLVLAIKNTFVAIALALLALPASSQSDLTTDPGRIARRDALIEVVSANADKPDLGAKVVEHLSQLPRDDAFNAEVDMLAWARKVAKVMTRNEFARAMLDAHNRWKPDGEIALDYWRYIVMISAKLDRGEIAVEEFDYLEGRKIAEAKAALRLEREESSRSDADHARRLADARAAVAQNESAQQSQDASGVGAVLQGVGEALRRINRPATTTNCYRVGTQVNCTSR